VELKLCRTFSVCAKAGIAAIIAKNPMSANAETIRLNVCAFCVDAGPMI
jgi:hypothetical protein